MSSIHWQASVHASCENFVPFDMTKFSRQFVPDLANCSLSTRKNRQNAYNHDMKQRNKVPRTKKGSFFLSKLAKQCLLFGEMPSLMVTMSVSKPGDSGSRP